MCLALAGISLSSFDVVFGSRIFCLFFDNLLRSSFETFGLVRDGGPKSMNKDNDGLLKYLS